MKIAPFLRRKIVEPVWAALRHSPLLKYWGALEETQYYSEENLKEIQWIKIKNLLQFVYDQNPYYNKLFRAMDLHPQHILSLSDLKKLPILTKKALRTAGDQLISTGFSKANLLHAKTGGSTGKSVHLYFTEDCSEQRNACARRHDRWSGWEVGEPKGYVWGNPPSQGTLKDTIKCVLFGTIIFLDTMEVTEKAVQEFALRWRRSKPTLLFGHAHSLYLLANLVREYHIEDIAPRAIISSSMMLHPHERRRIEDVFRTKVFDRYGCEEVGLIASECEMHEGMHLNIDNLFIEFLKEDGSDCEPGQPGRIIVTDLINTAMPLIRYQVEDVGVPSARKCSCGRGLPLIQQVMGRTADFLIKKDGTRVAGISIIENTLTKIPGIGQMQIIQNSLEEIQVKVTPDENYNPETSRILIHYLKELFQGPKNVEIELVEEIKSESNGKFRFSICRVDED